MRISDMSRQTGLSIATIKFYLREGLLPPGTPTARNQARYGPRHLARIRLIRVLAGIGRLELSSVRELLASIDDEDVSLCATFEVLDKALFPLEAELPHTAAVESTRADVDRFVAELGWGQDTAAPSRETLVQVVATLRSLGCERPLQFFGPFARAAEQLVMAELALLPDDGPDQGGRAVLRSVLFDTAFAAFRRMALNEHLASGLVPDPAVPDLA